MGLTVYHSEVVLGRTEADHLSPTFRKSQTLELMFWLEVVPQLLSH